MLIVALFIIDKTWKKIPIFINGAGLNKMRYIHKMDYYSAIKGMRYPYKNRNEVPSNYTE
jgi:hypothetical protein